MLAKFLLLQADSKVAAYVGLACGYAKTKRRVRRKKALPFGMTKGLRVLESPANGPPHPLEIN
ncbi:MAG: hypothetical protein ACK473_10195 [Sphingomonadales bacterium]|jgi:hypothetical protein